MPLVQCDESQGGRMWLEDERPRCEGCRDTCDTDALTDDGYCETCARGLCCECGQRVKSGERASWRVDGSGCKRVAHLACESADSRTRSATTLPVQP